MSARPPPHASREHRRSEADRRAFARRVVALVAAIPPGRVTTYGHLARLAGRPRHARMVGRLLAELPPGHDLPWHRVVNAAGRISPRGEGRAAQATVTRQQRLLEAEGVVFARGRLSLRRFGWRPELDGTWRPENRDAADE